MNSLVAVMVFTAVKSVGNLVPLVLVDWMGRKPLMVASHGAMALYGSTGSSRGNSSSSSGNSSSSSGQTSWAKK
ncbi:hypothetical protein QTP88_022266 [Uroleucon formosanum]